MNTRMQTDAWMYRIGVALALMLAASLASILFLTTMNQPVPKLLFVVGLVAASGLARILIPSPWSR